MGLYFSPSLSMMEDSRIMFISFYLLQLAYRVDGHAKKGGDLSTRTIFLDLELSVLTLEKKALR